MNLAEVNDLLTLAATLDNRRFDDATVYAWHEILGDLPFVDCRAAIFAHFAEQSDYLMPVHIRRLALEAERMRRRTERLAIEQAEAEQLAISATTTEDRSEQVKALIADLRDTLPPVDPMKFRRTEWVEVERHRERATRAEPNPLYDPSVHLAAVEEAASPSTSTDAS
jgi:hypothetical protein